MNRIINEKSTKELYRILDELYNDPNTTDEDAAMIFDIVQELIDRGEIPKITKEEEAKGWEDLQRRIKEEEIRKSSVKHGNYDWLKDALADVRADKLRRRLKYRRMSKIAAGSLLAILLANQLTYAVSGFNPIIRMIKWMHPSKNSESVRH